MAWCRVQLKMAENLAEELATHMKDSIEEREAKLRREYEAKLRRYLHIGGSGTR